MRAFVFAVAVVPSIAMPTASAAPMLELLESTTSAHIYTQVASGAMTDSVDRSFSHANMPNLEDSVAGVAVLDGIHASVLGVANTSLSTAELLAGLSTQVYGSALETVPDAAITVQTMVEFTGLVRLTENATLAVGLTGTSGNNMAGISAGLGFGFSAADGGVARKFDTPYPFVSDYEAGDYEFSIRVFLEGEAPMLQSGHLFAQSDSIAQMVVRIVPAPMTACSLAPLGLFASRRRR